MPWRISSAMSERHEFVLLAGQQTANIRELCRRFGITPKTGYKWLARFASEGVAGLADRSRRPHYSPLQTPVEIEKVVLKLRQQHPAWGGRKLAQRLLDLGQKEVPRPSTITEILRRNQQLDPQESAKHRAFQRFERAVPNELWQMDFKGEFQLPRGRCFPLTVLDDHSRFALGLQACATNTTAITQAAVIQIFRRYGLPETITCDNGPPWGTRFRGHYTRFGVWLLRLGIQLCHSRPHHPQTQGKDERFHRTLDLELLRNLRRGSRAHYQHHFDRWRHVYNTERPHEALGMKVPASRYQPSPRAYPERLPAIEYGPTDIVRKVRRFGHFKYRGQEYHVGSAFHGLHLALRYTATDGLLEVHFCQQLIRRINLRQ
ncbi:MAG TPA: IS481 family transposase [Pyrinomonadaceae bacterium]|nr:IS481 family transposase [Pyrinomonadaceae bacterium]